MKTRGTVRLATRGSQLAMEQASLVQSTLENRRYSVELVTIETTGDQVRDELIHRLGKTGAFVRELDERVLDGTVDAAIHSMKDVPTDQPEALVVAAVPERASPFDVLVTPDGSTLDELPDGAVVGTSSLRRRAQLLAQRPDLSVEPVRGNVDTRLEKCLAPAVTAEHRKRLEAAESDEDEEEDGDEEMADETADHDRTADTRDGADDRTDDDRTVAEWLDDLQPIERNALDRTVEQHYDAIVLAEAGLRRSGLASQVSYERLPESQFVPAPGQGALAVTMRDSSEAESIYDVIDHPRSRVETTVERSILAELGGGCIAPVGIYAVLQGEYVHASVQVFDRDGTESISERRDLPVETHADAARAFARHLADRGARELIERAQRTGADGSADHLTTEKDTESAGSTADINESTGETDRNHPSVSTSDQETTENDGDGGK